MLPISTEHFPVSGPQVSGWSKHSDRVKEVDYVENPPKISVITPSYNQAEFIEETIRSVLLQQYPNLEYIIIDGGSSDGSVEIIKKYEQWIDYWVSEQDEGQTDAINKGLNRASGEYIIYLNSDDIFFPGALHKVAEVALKHPDAPWLAGYTQVFGEGENYNVKKPDTEEIDKPEHWITYRVHVPQHSSFVKRSIYEEVGSYDESLDFVFDLDFGLRLGLKGLKPLVIDHTLAGFRIHGKSKTESSRLPFLNEQLSLLEKYKEDISEDAARKAHRFLKQHIAAHTLFDSLNTAKNNPLPVIQAACRSIWIDAAIIKQRYFWGALKQAIWQENEYGN